MKTYKYKMEKDKEGGNTIRELIKIRNRTFGIFSTESEVILEK